MNKPWEISDNLWAEIESLLSVHKTNHPLGTHRKRVSNRSAMSAIFLYAINRMSVEYA